MAGEKDNKPFFPAAVPRRIRSAGTLLKAAGIILSEVRKKNRMEDLREAGEFVAEKIGEGVRNGIGKVFSGGISAENLREDADRLAGIVSESLGEALPSALRGDTRKAEAGFLEISTAIDNLAVFGRAFPAGGPYPKKGTVSNRENPRPGGDVFSLQPFAEKYSDRKSAFLEYMVENGRYELTRAAASAALGVSVPVSDETIALYVRRLNERLDCADFYAIHVVHALFTNEIMPFLTLAQMDALREAMLDFKYWVDEPGEDRMISWTENHQILFHSVEYLAGQMFPDEIFRNNGKSGEWHMEHARRYALKWMERRARWGYSEWDSNEYYTKDVEALALLAEFSADRELAEAAAISLDLLLYDVACDLFKGMYACTHGRAYEDEILNCRDCEMAPAIKVVWGLGNFSGEGDTAALLLASAVNYEPNEIIVRIGQDLRESFYERQRHGIPLAKLKEYGLDPDLIENAPAIWGMGSFTHPEVVDLLVKCADQWNLWGHPFLDIAGPLHKFLPRGVSLSDFVKDFEIESSRTLLGEVNKATYMTQDYMLSSAQDYRSGERGNQQHVWQATLGPDAVVFTTNPGSFGFWDDEQSPDALTFTAGNTGAKNSWNRTPTYWAGQNRLPRIAQHKNLAIILYNIDMKKALGERRVYPFTHAFFPRWAFEEVREEGNWIFGRVGQGYVALFSEIPYKWNDADSEFAHDLLAYGKQNVWICQMGCEKEHGSFEDFVSDVISAGLKVDGLDVNFDAPGVGGAVFSWNGPFTIDGEEIPLSGFKRSDNEYCLADFDGQRYEITHGGETLILDLEKRLRESR